METAKLDLSEKALARLWQQRHIPGGVVRTPDGRQFRVLYPGRRGGPAGPDFTHALLLDPDGRLLRGDIELHLRPAGWRAHGHHRDPRYARVVLHVVLHGAAAGAVETVSGRRVPTAEPDQVSPIVDSGGEARSSGAAADAWRLAGVPPAEAPRSAEAFHALLERAGDARFESHVRLMAGRVAALGADGALWLGVMEGLGYAANRDPMRTLAERLPWAALRTGVLSLEPDQRGLWLSETLLRAAGLHPDQSPMPTAAGLDWRFVGLRPNNHPRVRLAGAACLALRWLEAGPAAALLGALRDGGCRSLAAGLTVERTESGGTGAVGRKRALAMAASTVLPGIGALADMGRDMALRQSVEDCWRALPASGDNALTREALARLAAPGWDLRVATARREQGLIALALRMAGG